MSHVVSPNVALVIGGGPGLGQALCRIFAEDGIQVAAACRNRDNLDPLFKGLRITPFTCDVTREDEVADLFGKVNDALGRPDVVVFNVGSWLRKPMTELETSEFKEVWDHGCLGAFIVGRQAARTMLERGTGTILFTGATAALRGAAGFSAFAVAKHGVRALSQSMAREFGPLGIHVAHVIVDGIIGESDDQSRLDPKAIAETYLALHKQPKSVWTQELDLRPWVERF